MRQLSASAGGPIEALTEADAFASLGQGRRSAMWDAKAIERDMPPLLRLIENTFNDAPLIPEPQAALPSESSGQANVTDYAATGLTLPAHPLSVLQRMLTSLGYHDTRPPGLPVPIFARYRDPG